MAFEFTPDLETKNPLIDQQHKQLIGAFNKLLEANSKGKGKEELEKTIQFLCSYTAKHFLDEEQLQIKSAYPDYINHKKYHEEFKKTVATLKTCLDSEGGTLALNVKLGSAAAWLMTHIKTQDTKVAKHIRG